MSGESFRAKRARIDAEHFGAAGSGLQYVHQDLDGGGFACAIGPSQAEHAAFGNREVQAVEYGDFSKLLDQIDRVDDVAHSFLRALAPSIRYSSLPQ